MDRHRAQDNFEIAGEKQTTMPVGETARHSTVLMATDEMRQAKAWLEVIKTPPTPDQELLAIHGWLSPEGLLYPCAWQTHDELTKALGFRHESDIETAGYCKLSQLKWLVQPRYCEKGVTNAQWKTIERWYERNGFPDEHFMRLSALT